jgi:type II secretory pathway component GspD/PulD (secretin)
VLAIFVGLVAAAASAERRIEIYRPYTRTAAELLGPAQAALGAGGTATVDAGTNALVLAGEADAVEAALGVLAQLDLPLATVVLHYESQRLADLTAAGVRVDWTISAGSFRVGNVWAPPGTDLVAIRPLAEKTKRTSRLAGMLRVQDGQVGRIETGSSVPIATRVSPWESQVGFVSATSGFEARPQLQADGRVRVAIQPFEGSLGRGGVVHQSGAATEVTVKPGDTIAIGGLTQAQEQRSAGTGGALREERSEDWLLLLRAEVESAPARR